MKRSCTAIFTAAPEGGYAVEIPALPGCVSQGDTYEEAVANIREAMEGWIEVARECGDSLPEPGEVLTVEIPLPA